MADTSLVGESATLLADLQARLRTEEETRKRNLRRAYAGVAVAVVHILFVALLITSEWIPIPIPKARKIEPLQWVSLPRRAAVQPPERIKPRVPDPGTFNPDVVLRLPKPRVEEESNAISDFGLALGRSLACGANSYEWLNPKRRAECAFRPWNFVYDHYGNMVLDARPRMVREEETLRPSDAQARERNTVPLCPTNIDPNAPCLSSIIGGRR